MSVVPSILPTADRGGEGTEEPDAAGESGWFAETVVAAAASEASSADGDADAVATAAAARRLRKGFWTARLAVEVRWLRSLWLTRTSTPGDCSRKEAASWAQEV